MPTGPRGEKRPADVIGCAVMVAKIATDEVEEELQPEPAHREAKSRAGNKGGKARSEALTPERRAEIAAQSAAARRGDDDEDTVAA
ncbi:MAG: RNA-binding protein [Chloroflexi bacterium]|nr:RNA-binding protein [Chloroflexota bacterium]